MNGFLEKLERVTERWIRIVDGQIHDATVRTITGQVFTDDLSENVTGPKSEAVSQDTGITSLTPLPTRESHKPDTSPYPPVLKKARASYK